MPAAFNKHQIGLLATLAILALVFHLGYQCAVEPFFPAGFDQVHHRMGSAIIADYTSQDGISGFFRGVGERSTAQGFVHVTAGGIATLLDLDPTYAFFGLFLFSLWLIHWAMSDRGTHPWRGWAAISCVLAMRSLTVDIGSALDFRPDFAGQTLWTTAAALAISSRCFRDRKFTLMAGLILALAFCTRSLTLPYAFAAAPALFLGAWFGGEEQERRTRLSNLGIGIALAGALALPYFIICFDTLKHYYIDNHISAKENEARGFVGGFLEHLSWYWHSMRHDHLGTTGQIMFGLVFVTGLIFNTCRSILRSWPSLIIGLGFCSPLFVMSMGPQYSWVTSGACAGSVMLLCLIPRYGSARFQNRKLAPVILLTLLAWPVLFTLKTHRYADTRAEQQHQNANTVLDLIIAKSSPNTACTISTLHLIEAISRPMLRLRSYATGLGTGDHFQQGLGHTIYAAESKQELLDKLRQSDIVVHWVGRASGGDLPFNRQVDEHITAIQAVLNQEFRKISPTESLLLEGHALEIYAH